MFRWKLTYDFNGHCRQRIRNSINEFVRLLSQYSVFLPGSDDFVKLQKLPSSFLTCFIGKQIRHAEAAHSILKRKADRQEAQLLSGMIPGDTGWGYDPDPLLAYDAKGSEQEIPALCGDQRRYYAGIVDALTGIGPNPVPPSQALAVMAVIEAVNRSARKRASVGLDLTKEEIAAWR